MKLMRKYYFSFISKIVFDVVPSLIPTEAESSTVCHRDYYAKTRDESSKKPLQSLMKNLFLAFGCICCCYYFPT